MLVKFILVGAFFMCLAGVITSKPPGKHHHDDPVYRACVAEYNVTLPQFPWSANAMELPENAQCFLKCLVVGRGILVEDGELDKKALLEKARENKILEDEIGLIEKCIEPVEDESCSSVAAVVLCIRADWPARNH